MAFFAPVYTAAQDSNSNTNAASTPPPTPLPTPIAISAIVAQAEAVTTTLQENTAFLNARPKNQATRNAIPQLADEIERLSSENKAALDGRPSLDELNTLEREWSTPTQTIAGWKKDIEGQIASFDKRIDELRKLNDLWQLSLEEMTQPPASTANVAETSAAPVPVEIRGRIEETIASITETLKLLDAGRAELLSLQTQVSDLDARVNGEVATIKERRSTALSKLFVRDSPAMWSLNWHETNGRQMLGEISDTVSARAAELSDYSVVQSDRFIFHGAIFLLFAAALFWVRSRVKSLVEKEPTLERSANIFAHPIASGLLLSIVFAGWFYPQPPRLMSAALGAAALIPVVILLRRLVDRPLILILYVLVGFYFFDRLREITSGLAILSRIMFLGEMLAAVLFLFYLLRSKSLAAKVEAGKFRLFQIIRRIVPFAIAIFAIGFITNLLGFVSLSNIIGNGVLRSAYVAVIFYTAVEVIDGLVLFALRVKPLSSLGLVKNNRMLVHFKAMRIVQWLAIILWIFVALILFSVRDAVFSFLGEIISAEFNVGSFKLTAGHFVAFVFAVWITFVLSRFLRFVLEEDVFPRTDLGEGVSYAISTMVHYVVLILGFIIAIASLGFELSQFAIIAGAVGIGVGFGLQNIINNFVSGLILLFERPVKVGDLVQIGEHQGNLSQIGLRASVLRKVDGSDVIVPNSQLISEEVINWTMSDDKRRIDIPVGVAYGTDPKRVLEILSNVATGVQYVMTDPAPRALFIGFGDSSLDFELRAWTDNSDEWVALRSELVTAVSEALTLAEIEIPFPQRDLNLRTVDKSAIKDLKSE
ncbi:MAG: mechanosensitive ion channel domain-containing protein [Pyrinomonadaceae bacterium]